MQAKLIQSDEGMAVLIAQSLLDQLNITPNTSLEIATDGQALMITPVTDEARRAAFEAAIEKMDRQYASVFQRLAE